MHCDVYKFAKHPEMYVYIACPDNDTDNDTDCDTDTVNVNVNVNVTGSSPKSLDFKTHTAKDRLHVLPQALRQSLGEGEFLLHLDLAAKDKLARVDIHEVRNKLSTQGYFLQSPPADVLTARAQASMKAAQDKKYD